MARGYGEGNVNLDHRGSASRDPTRHRNCTGRWVGIFYFEGRKQPKAYGNTKAEVQNKISDKQDELGAGIVSDDSYTVEMAINDWLADRKGIAQSTIDTARSVTRPLIELIGSKKIKRLVAADVLGTLEDNAATRCDRGYARQGTGRAYSTVHRTQGHLVNARAMNNIIQIRAVS